MNITLEEQEILISASRTEDMAQIYCSDSTWITKMDKLVVKSPTLFTVVAQDEVSKTYEFPKKLISIRSSIMQRELTEEQKQAAGERFAKARQSKKQTAE